MRKLFFIAYLFIVSAFPAYPTSYYFSGSGNDNNSGTSATSPFKTIAKLNSLTLNPGDNVYFNRGEVFAGQIDVKTSGSSASYITFDAYGTGAAPVITGAVAVTGWQLSTGGKYVADVPALTTQATQLFANGTLMTLARFPNSGFLPIESSTGNSNLSSSGLTQTSGVWNGATLMVRTERWTCENLPVSSYTPGTVNLGTPAEFSFKTGWGFYMVNSLNALDAPGEWYHDVVAKKIYFIAPGGVNPSTMNVTASAYTYGFNISAKNYININNLNISYQGMDGIYLSNAAGYVSINNCNFSYSFSNGIYSDDNNNSSANHITIQNNTFTDIGGSGIKAGTSTFCTIKWNTLNRIGLVFGMGGRSGGKYFGIIAGTDSYIGYNTVNNIGYNGIHYTSWSTVEYNQVSNVCMTLDDGAGLYSYSSNNIIVKNNTVVNAIGNGQASDSPDYFPANGIYLDDNCSYVTVSKNTVVNGDYGIFIHNSNNNTLQQNVVYNNRAAQLYVQSNYAPPGVQVTNNTVTDNTFYSVSPDQMILSFYTMQDNIRSMANIDRNYYCNPYSDILFKTIYVPSYPTGTKQKDQMYNFTTWRTTFGQDGSSKISKVNFAPYYKIQNEGENLIDNGNFDSGNTIWYSWYVNTLSIDPANPAMSGNSLKNSYGSSTNTSGNFAAGGFTVAKGNYYKLSFRAIGTKLSNLDFDITQNTNPFKSATGSTTGFKIESTPANYEYIFQSKADYTNSRVVFSSTSYDSDVWIDDFAIKSVTVDTNTSTPHLNSPIFINTSGVSRTFTLPGSFLDLDGNAVSSSITVPAYSAQIYVKNLTSSTKTDQTINFPDLQPTVIGAAPFPVTATASSGLPVTFTSSNPAVATVSGNTITVTGPGTIIITAIQVGNYAYNSKSDTSQLTVLNTQTIDFPDILNKTYGDPAFAITATASSGLPVTFSSSNPAVATVSGNMVTITGGGTVTITAKQNGNASYAAAKSVDKTFTVNPATQTITFNSLQPKAYGDPAFFLSSSASSGLPISYYSSSNTSVATISGNKVTIVGVGEATITSGQNGDANYKSATQTQLLTVSKGKQAITFSGQLQSKTYGDAPFTISASASSGLPVTFSSSDAAVATVSGNTVTITGGGPVTITAKQNGNDFYEPAQDQSQSFTVGQASQTITFSGQLLSKTYGDAPFTISANASSGLPVTFSSSNTAVATVSGNTVTITGVGPVTITAKQNGNASYAAAQDQSQSFTVGQASQTITFSGPLPSKTYGDAPFTLSASASSGLPVTYSSSNPAIATVYGNTVTITGGGFVTITAKQNGNASYAPAQDQTQSFTVNPASQTITFTGPLPSKTYGDAPFTLSASASSGLPVTYSSSNPAIATISGNTVTITGVGPVTISAKQNGNASYAAAQDQSQSFTVDRASQTITFTIPPKVYGDPDFYLSSSASSGLPISYYSSSNTSVATISGNKVTIVGVGITTITSGQNGDANYYPASQPLALNVGLGTQTITFNPLPPKTVGDAPFYLSSSASSGLAISYYSSSNTSVATISGNKVTIVGPGTTTITSGQNGNTYYNSATASQVLTVNSTQRTGAVTVFNDSTGNTWSKNEEELNKEKNIRLYPNPVSVAESYITLDLTSLELSSPVTIDIYNSKGVCIQSLTGTGLVGLPTSGLAPGEYTVRIKSKRLIIKKFVKM